MTDQISKQDIEAGLDIPVAHWKRASEIINCIITSNHAAQILRADLSRARSATPVPLADVGRLEERLAFRRVTHRHLLAELNATLAQLAHHLERAGGEA